jgi:hypothetical protein
MPQPLSSNPYAGGGQSTNSIQQARGPYIINVGIKQVVGAQPSQNFWALVSSNSNATISGSSGTTTVATPYVSSVTSNVYIPSNLYVGGTIYGTVVAPSDITVKENVESLELFDPKINEKLMSLDPKSYSYIHDENHYQHFGFIAQDVEKVFPSLIYEHYDPLVEKNIKAVNYVEMIPLLLLKIKDQEKEMNRLKEKVKEQQFSILREIQNIKGTIEDIKKMKK